MVEDDPVLELALGERRAVETPPALARMFEREGDMCQDLLEPGHAPPVGGRELVPHPVQDALRACLGTLARRLSAQGVQNGWQKVEGRSLARDVQYVSERAP